LLEPGEFATIGAVTRAARGLRDWQPDFSG